MAPRQHERLRSLRLAGLTALIVVAQAALVVAGGSSWEDIPDDVAAKEAELIVAAATAEAGRIKRSAQRVVQVRVRACVWLVQV